MAILPQPWVQLQVTFYQENYAHGFYYVQPALKMPKFTIEPAKHDANALSQTQAKTKCLQKVAGLLSFLPRS